jgi:uncharacterized protein YyaL (SSP411 family)
MANQLAGAGSLYLRQHASNPVDWHPWGDEAIELARAHARPIFLSIGFATCHWCHVMARESFADDGVARILNEHFVSIKVDREERPDLDRVYLDALRRLTGRAGWPATIFLTPELEPFFAGTYFPPEPRDGLPGLKRLLHAIADAWRDQRATLVENARRLSQDHRAVPPEDTAPEEGPLLERAAAAHAQLWDRECGGLGRGSKFPSAPNVEYLFERARGGDLEAGGQVELTLLELARGGIYDHVGGGFHRYAIDRRWQVPHFEKALTDNALLARCYLAAWKVTGEARFARIVGQTLDYLRDELRHPDGAFASGQDADSDGREGAYYVWSFAELEAVVGSEAASALGATPDGNWEGTNVLRLADAPDDAELADWRSRLRAARAGRASPARDDKVVAGWNGLAVSAFADAARCLGSERYVRAAEDAAEFVFEHLRRGDGRLMRSWSDGRTSGPGFLDDYAFLGLACLALHQATLSSLWLERALELADDVTRLFAEPDGNRLFLTGIDVVSPLGRPVDGGGLALPSATSAGAELLWRVGRMTGDGARSSGARNGLRPLLQQAGERPEEHAHALTLLGLMQLPPREVALIGERSAGLTQALADVVARTHHPEAVFAAWPDGGGPIALLEGRPATAGIATAYVCEGMQCLRPTSEPSILAGQLSGASHV